MQITPTFLPIAEKLIDQVFPTNVVFHQHDTVTYDPVSGNITHSSGSWDWPSPGTADYGNSNAACVTLTLADFDNSDIGNTLQSICDNPLMLAGTTEFDNADVTPRATRIPGGDVDIPIKAGVLSRRRTEEGGTSEAYEIDLWVHHGTAGLPFLPTTEDSFTYDSTFWRITAIAPTYSSEGLIASKITGRS